MWGGGLITVIMQYKTFEELEKAIDEAIYMSLDSVVANKIKDDIAESVERNVYTFHQREYVRTGELGSKETKKHYIDRLRPLHYAIMVDDVTEQYIWNPPTAEMKEMGKRRISDIVETGRGYLYRNPGPRPYMQPVQAHYDDYPEEIANTIVETVNTVI